MAAVMIGIDPHKASHTAVVISAAEEALGELRVRASAGQAEQLLAWAAAWPQRTWAVEGAAGLGHLLARQLLSAGERVLDVQPKLGARVRLLAAGDTNKNDPDDARSVAVAALRSPGVREAVPDDHAAVPKVWSKRYRDLGRTRTQVVCRLHAVLCELVPGGVSKRITAGQAARVLGQAEPRGAAGALDRPGPLRPGRGPGQQPLSLGHAGADPQLTQRLLRRADRHRRMRSLVGIHPDHHCRHRNTSFLDRGQDRDGHA